MDIIIAGTPFTANPQTKDGLIVRRMIVKIFEALFNNGWEIGAGIDVVKNSRDIGDTVLFQRIYKFDPASLVADPKGNLTVASQKETRCCMVMFSSNDRITFINVPKKVINSLVPNFLKKAKVLWKKGVAYSKPIRNDVAYEIRMKGQPWAANNASRSLTARRLIISLIQEMRREGYEVYSAVNVTKAMQDMIVFKQVEAQLVESESDDMVTDSDEDEVVEDAESHEWSSDDIQD
eukprot:TRINITY_DN8785_c0_g1_i1.p1 TRINITY_DN8785_c0_g1~~TRINITY_DN8785_c0_g1_i1.p1  ORF type:complete len:235 (+),score=36.24 TRINITY_DN8785_c0_g1_i1:251-955(+)